jgi:hypothetical protein
MLGEINSNNRGVFKQEKRSGCKPIIHFVVAAHENTYVVGRRVWQVFSLNYPPKGVVTICKNSTYSRFDSNSCEKPKKIGVVLYVHTKPYIQ